MLFPSLRSLPWKQVQERRDAFPGGRQDIAVTDEQFVNQVYPQGVSVAERRVTAILRQVIAEQCGVPAEKLQATDQTRHLETPMGTHHFIPWLLDHPYQCRFDVRAVHFALEWKLGELTLRRFIPLRTVKMDSLATFRGQRPRESDVSRTLGDWIKAVVPHVVQELAHLGVQIDAYWARRPEVKHEGH
jgi:hypothetical protein